MSNYSAGQELSSLAFDKIIGGALDAVVKAQSNSSITTVNFIKETGFLKNGKGEVTEPIYVSFSYPKEIAPYIPKQKAAYRLVVLNGGSGYSAQNFKSFTVNGAETDGSITVDSNGTIMTAEITGNVTVGEDCDVIVNLLDENDSPTETAKVMAKKTDEVPAVLPVYENMELKVPILTMLPIPYIRIASTDIEFNVKINSISNTTSEESSDKTVGGSGSIGYHGFGVSANVSFNASMSSQKKSSSTDEVKKEFSLNIKVHAVQDEMPAGISRILDILEESIVPKTKPAA